MRRQRIDVDSVGQPPGDDVRVAPRDRRILGNPLLGLAPQGAMPATLLNGLPGVPVESPATQGRVSTLRRRRGSPGSPSTVLARGSVGKGARTLDSGRCQSGAWPRPVTTRPAGAVAVYAKSMELLRELIKLRAVRVTPDRRCLVVIATPWHVGLRVAGWR